MIHFRISNMVDRPALWKRELQRIGRRMEQRARRKRWGPSYNFPFERDLLFAACVIRKLMESDQYPSRLLKRTIDPIFYPARNSEDLREKVIHFAHNYEMMKGQKKPITVRALMSQIIHSYYFSPFVAPEWGVFGVFVSSDQAKDMGLYYITFPKLARTIADYALI